MQRVHVVEFEDYPWFPGWLRAAMTDLLVVLAQKLDVPAAIAQRVEELRDEAEFDQLVDLGSGSGGSMPDVQRALAARGSALPLVLTDLHPSPALAARFRDHDAIRYELTPVDATTLASAPAGLRTMVNSFHHLRPDDARAVLAAAQASGQPFLLFELGENKLPFPLWLVSLPLALPLVFLSALVLTAFVRPLTPTRLFFTYLVPLIPLFYAWDGQASMPRIYTRADLEQLLSELGSQPGAADYTWSIGHAQGPKGRPLGFTLQGLPRRRT